MKKSALVLLLYIFLGSALHAQTVQLKGITGQGAYLPANGIQIYYEVFGEGEPLLILHGNGGSTQGRHHIIPDLARHFQVIAMDSRCHGKSDCPASELNYQDMAEDAHALMKHLGHDNYTIWGHSDGGILGLILGYKHPESIHSMLISGANIRPDSTALHAKLVEFVQRYEEIPDERLKKQIKLMAYHPNIPIDKIKEINVPVVLMVGDRDAVKMEHTLEIFEALPRANLCVLPGTTHFVSHEREDQIVFWIQEMKKPFKQPSTVDIAEQMAKQLFGN